VPHPSTENVELSRSGWLHPPDDRLPSLTGSVRTDCAVIGGGYTGMAAALRLAERGADVVLVESEFCGRGASSRNAGHLTPTVAGDPLILTTLYRHRARELIRVAENAVRFAQGLITRLGIECDYEGTGNVSAALTTGQLRRSERITRSLCRAGADVEFVEGSESGLPEGFLGGILERAGGHLNPGSFARGLRTAIRSSGVRLFEGSPVRVVEPHGDGVIVRTPGGDVHAGQVLLATNAYAGDLAVAPRRVVVPVWVTLAESDPIEAERLRATGWTSRAGLYTQHVILEDYRPTARGSVLMGTRKVQRPRGALGDRTPDPAVVADLHRGFRDRFPALADVPLRRAWGGWIAMTPSWLPVAGEAEPGISYALGYNGHGLAQAPYLGTLMADRLAGDPRHEDLEVLWRRRPRFAPAPLFSVPALRLGWTLDRATDRIAERKRGPSAAKP
jgi:glycine/D-amino acid oxidase-like deaminating enzyme